MSSLVIDTSAAVAIVNAEPESHALIPHLESAERRMMSAATLVELGIVLESQYGPHARGIAESFIFAAEIEIEPVDEVMARTALQAWRTFGKGRHPARLNFGDCFTYALAAVRAAPVLCIGNDFGATDCIVVELGSSPG